MKCSRLEKVQSFISASQILQHHQQVKIGDAFMPITCIHFQKMMYHYLKPHTTSICIWFSPILNVMNNVHRPQILSNIHKMWRRWSWNQDSGRWSQMNFRKHLSVTVYGNVENRMMSHISVTFFNTANIHYHNQMMLPCHWTAWPPSLLAAIFTNMITLINDILIHYSYELATLVCLHSVKKRSKCKN